ncbi:hypothetical protein [Saccharolobus islandicus]|uniref:hypothetical protein n=1 Tax=Saccharolobus islandicus TaxID=43080 RepID=UPI0004916146|nr:hypothetical protein [Sulfolobus islandicus]
MTFLLLEKSEDYYKENTFEGFNPNDYWEFSWDEYEYLKFKNAKYGKPKSLLTDIKRNVYLWPIINL